jgi:hypothetical protein
MELSNEDNLRLHVLLMNPIQALRIDESTMTVYALSHQGEAKVQLHPTCRDGLYLRRVRELISSHILGSPGGYPTYLQRWTRMGQMRDDHLEQLLMLGEPEAVVAVVHAQGLTLELARRAWWALPTAENARSMLTKPNIINSELGKQLATYLVEYLPFEEEPAILIETVRLILQSDLIDAETRQRLWIRGRSKSAYLVGFLKTLPDDLPNSDTETLSTTELTPLFTINNPVAQQLIRLTSLSGQNFMATCERVLRKPANQDVVNSLFEAISDYFASIRPSHYDDTMDLEELITRATQLVESKECPEINAVLTVMPMLQHAVQAMLILSGLRYSIVRPVFSRTTAIGSLMRQKLLPITGPLLEQFSILRQLS